MLTQRLQAAAQHLPAAVRDDHHVQHGARRIYARFRWRQKRTPLPPRSRTAVPASTIRSAVGPEPRSNAEPRALGSVAAVGELGEWRRVVPKPRRWARRLRFCFEVCARAFAVWLETDDCVEPFELVACPLLCAL